MFNWFWLWLQRRRFQRYNEWYQSLESIKNFTAAKCPTCQTPASSAHANFCAECGTYLRGSGRTPTCPLPATRPARPTVNLATLPMPGKERHTDPVALPSFPDYVRSHRPDVTVGPDTQLHRAIHLPQGYKTAAMKKINMVMGEDPQR